MTNHEHQAQKAAVGAIALMASLAPVAASAASFPDVPQNYWGYATINWAADNGVVAGYPDGTFKPENNVTEAEFLTMLVKAYHPQLPQVEVHQWADPVYAFARQMNYPLSGYDNMSARDWVITRQHVAEIMAGASGVNYTGRDAIQYVLAKGLAKGEDPNHITIESFNGQGLLTRAEAVAFVQNAMQHGLKQLMPRPQQPSDPKLLPPLPGQQPTQPTQPQPPVQPPTQPNQPSQPTVGLPTVSTWTPGDSTVLGKAFFSSFKINGDGTVTVRIPTLEELGPNAVWTGGSYEPPRGSGMMGFNIAPGETRTLKMGSGATISTSLLTTASKGNMEGYTVFLDGSWKVYVSKRVNGQFQDAFTTLDAVMKGLGLK